MPAWSLKADRYRHYLTVAYWSSWIGALMLELLARGFFRFFGVQPYQHWNWMMILLGVMLFCCVGLIRFRRFNTFNDLKPSLAYARSVDELYENASTEPKACTRP